MSLRNSETSSGAGTNYRGELRSEDWDWTFLNDSFPRGIRMGDIDGCVEINCNFLEVEGKQAGIELPKGQAYMYYRKSALPNYNVVVIEGNPPCDITGWRCLHNPKASKWPDGWHFNSYEGDMKDFAKFVHRWSMFSDATYSA